MINPGYIFGEIVSSGDSTSSSFVSKMMMNKIYAYPNIRFNLIDIKDCALAHLRALERPEAAGKRFILANRLDMPMVEMANELSAALNENGFNYQIKRR